jgi:hypothetical protein
MLTDIELEQTWFFIDPDISKAFPTDASVNEALRLLLQISQRQQA